MARARTWQALLLGAVAAAVIAPPASAADEEQETPAPTRAPGDTITPLLVPTGRPAELSARAGRFSFYVGGAATVTHRITYRGRLVGSRTVTCPQARAWVVRVDFQGASQRLVRRLLADPRDDVLTWDMTLTDARGNVAHRTVDVPL